MRSPLPVVRITMIMAVAVGASDLVTVTPNDVEPIGAKPLDGVLLPCPDLP